jgi:hypothetical protein
MRRAFIAFEFARVLSTRALKNSKTKDARSRLSVRYFLGAGA